MDEGAVGDKQFCEFAGGVKMFCKACDYNLSSTSPHRCPECGEAFDPADPQLARPRFRQRMRTRRGICVIGWLVVAWAWLFTLTPFIAWAPQELSEPDGAGPWSHPGFPGGLLYWPWWLGARTFCPLWLPILALGAGAWILHIDKSRGSKRLLLTWFVLSLLATAAIGLYFTPLGRVVMEWWID